jgi:hypothetical protein
MTEKFEKNQVLPRGSSAHFNKFTQSCKTYHFIVKSMYMRFRGQYFSLLHSASTPANLRIANQLPNLTTLLSSSK